ncbi:MULTISPECIES: SPOR domain-containing protein [unclassified Polaribacter]|uniref:SPOR domain-containing protein n=1 Tax=unclassified Polaribacter TaxID=196858 RepID=UPI0011BED88C|nr:MULTISPECIES: SPOR domain-containing protein [unclassified Polaribacter]TXD51314.1 SPOR domain-containing protein [Polaribacter sp. IC063]TXD57041.1 SPOR domain-containing protein [Polaribacter sp. IC066]
MKNIATLLFILVFILSCGKKGLKKENEEVIEPVLIETVVQVDEDTSEEEVLKLVFTVQIAALRNKNEKLAAIDSVRIYEENSLSKYSLGTFKTYEEARAYRLKLMKAYKGAFVQALKNNNPISITEALQ